MIVHKTDVPRSERTAKFAPSAKNTDTRVELHQLDAGHESGMAWEVQIVHPDRSPASGGSSGTEGPQAPEVFRFRREDQARHAYEVYAKILLDPDAE